MYSDCLNHSSIGMQPFLIWKHPVRVHKHKKAVQPEADSWKFINEGFYDDYTDNYNSKQALLKMGRYYNTTMRHYWDMLVK